MRDLVPALLVFLPVVGAYLLHGPVLRFDLWSALRRPLDGGVTVRGRRLFGDNKTWRGALVMLAGVVGASVALSSWPGCWGLLPEAVRRAGPWEYGLLLGLGVVVGELPNSFLKRKLDIAPGAQRRSFGGVLFSLIDQGDFVLGSWVTLAPVWLMPLSSAAACFAVAVVGHLGVSGVGYALKMRKSWL
jgi:CDP-diglyceride synthetase